MFDMCMNILCNPPRFVKLKYISNFMLIYAHILTSSNHIDILHVDA